MGKERGKVNPERVRQRFSREFKLEAVRLLEQGGKPATQLAMELGIQRNRLYKWQKELGAKGGSKMGSDTIFRDTTWGKSKKPRFPVAFS